MPGGSHQLDFGVRLQEQPEGSLGHAAWVNLEKDMVVYQQIYEHQIIGKMMVNIIGNMMVPYFKTKPLVVLLVFA